MIHALMIAAGASIIAGPVLTYWYDNHAWLLLCLPVVIFLS